MSILIWQNGGEKRSILDITGTSNLISVIYCVQKPDTGWQGDIDERRLMSEKITARWIFLPPPAHPFVSFLTPLLFMLREYLSWLGINTARSWYTAALLGAFILHLYYKNRKWIMCISTWKMQMQMQSFWVSKCIFTFYKKQTKPECPIWKNTVDSGICLAPTYAWILMSCSPHVSNSYMCVALTTTALSWVPRPASLGCSPQPDARLQSCPSYCGGLFQCTPSPGPRTRWAAETHKYFLSHSSHTQLNRNLLKMK